MSKYEVNGIEAARIKSIELIDGHIYRECYLDPFIQAPAGFIALRPTTIIEGDPIIIKFVKVSNIASFNIEEGEAGKLWQQFDITPETIATKQL